jgi:alkylmercury lyase
MNRNNVRDDAQKFVTFLNSQLSPTLAQLIRELVVRGGRNQPSTVAELAAAVGVRTEQARSELATLSNLDIDDEGRVIGLHRASSTAPHKFTVDGAVLYGCASDTLTFPVIIDRPGVVESTCPVTGRPIRIEVTPTEVVSVDPPEAVVSKVRPTEGVGDLVTDICGNGRFFASPEAAESWLTHNPQGEVVPVAEEFDINRLATTEIGHAALSNERSAGGCC